MTSGPRRRHLELQLRSTDPVPAQCEYVSSLVRISDAVKVIKRESTIGLLSVAVRSSNVDELSMDHS